VSERAGILDLQRLRKIAGARFCGLQGWGARLERALANFFSMCTCASTTTPKILPPLPSQQRLLALPPAITEIAADLFRVQDTDFWHNGPHSEVELHNLYRDETPPQGELPIHVTAWTACFRSEARCSRKRHAWNLASAPGPKSRALQVRTHR